MRELLHHLARVNMRILQHLCDGVDGSDGQFVFRKQLERFGARQLAQPGVADGAELAIVAETPRHGVETWLEREIGNVERAAEVLPLFLVGGADIDEAVPGLERFVGNDRWMPRAEPLRRLAGG